MTILRRARSFSRQTEPCRCWMMYTSVLSCRRSAGTHVYYPHLFDIRSTSSSVRKAGAPDFGQEAVGGLSNFTSPIHHKNTRNSHMVAEQEFRTTTPEPASQRQSAAQQLSRPPPESASSEDDESSTPSMEQSDEAAPATTVSNNNKALKRCWRM